MEKLELRPRRDIRPKSMINAKNIGKLLLFVLLIVALRALYMGELSVEAIKSHFYGGTAGSEMTAEQDVAAEGTVSPEEMPDFLLVNDSMSNLEQADVTKPVFDAHTVAERQTQGLPTAMPQVAPYTQKKVAYLTFDDGPDDKNTPVILDILKNYGVKGTFYVTGAMSEQNPEILKRIFIEGHAIGNHSYNHNYNELYASKESFLAQIMQTDDVIKKIIGVRPLIVRAPGGAASMFDADYMPFLTSYGYAEHDWNVSTEDATAERPNAAQELAHVDEQTKGAMKDDAAIVLMHSTIGKEETAAALPSIIMLLAQKGYSFGVVTPMTPQPW